jgi:hypothetical protein
VGVYLTRCTSYRRIPYGRISYWAYTLLGVHLIGVYLIGRAPYEYISHRRVSRGRTPY